MKKTYEIEMSSTTYRTFEVEADSPEDAQNIAFAQLEHYGFDIYLITNNA